MAKAIEGKRDKVIVTTKTGVIRTKTKYLRDFSPKNILMDIHESLTRLKTDCIDLLHSLARCQYAAERIGKHFGKAKKTGKVSVFGRIQFYYGIDGANSGHDGNCLPTAQLFDVELKNRGTSSTVW